MAQLQGQVRGINCTKVKYFLESCTLGQKKCDLMKLLKCIHQIPPFFSLAGADISPPRLPLLWHQKKDLNFT